MYIVRRTYYKQYNIDTKSSFLFSLRISDDSYNVEKKQINVQKWTIEIS